MITLFGVTEDRIDWRSDDGFIGVAHKDSDGLWTVKWPPGRLMAKTREGEDVTLVCEDLVRAARKVRSDD